MPNLLAAEKSPYLRQHADNPVDWRPWGEAALAQARNEGKPVFLSIGYSTCHWCHVMAHESFEDPAVAAVLNRDFVPVKLDREERPDLDRVYMTYVQQTTGSGGWPMSVWLTPEGKPFFGGTYFPKEDRHGRPGFLTLLTTIAVHWGTSREKIETGAEEVVQALRRYAVDGAGREEKPAGEPVPLHEAAGEAFEKCFQYFYEAHDARWGGFGGAPKFPRASILDFLFRSAALQGAATDLGQTAIGMAATTLQRMIEGGLHDHLGGGFHRYSVDAEWHVPHFEKMLYDQALIALNCLEAQQATGLPVFGWAARDIFDYVARDLTSPQGGFYSAEDADSAPLETARSDKDQGSSDKKAAHAEGAFYVWTKAEIETVLGTDAEFFCGHYDVKPDGNVASDPHGEFGGKNVLRQLRPLARTAELFKLPVAAAEEKLLGCLEKLRLERAKRPRPHRDDKILTAWNGLMISALARGQQILGGAPAPGPESRGGVAAAPGYLGAATRAAEFIARELYDPATGLLYRSWREGRSDIPGFAEDYAYLIQGLLDLYEAGFQIRWLQWAEVLQAKMNEHFWDDARGGYFNSRADDPTVIVRLKEDYDGAEPAPNSVAAMNLLRLDWMLGEAAGVADPGAGDSYRDRALKAIGALRSQWSRLPQALPQMLGAIELALADPRTVVLAGDPHSPEFQAMTAVLHEALGPRRAILALDGAAGQAWLAARRPYLAGMNRQAGRVTAYVCERFACQAPVGDPVALRAALLPG
ncbi:hypothetical protein Verru16b_00927 [Lacunisphaera limnophila]|uniref:Spermatogenesis-associated protein 20-like TRX domain-containing protein n=1 Tax=Lacunisphaera limnophila TaxID=1838286 RepID=A0A1D8ASJ8_9BACT|nr:thioredoxin domain-containing protein [Lacunisphaera limnophila]AOS43869.1 hypothetical protein Verru16b_00927 [Lacunisphaera limnophila]